MNKKPDALQEFTQEEGTARISRIARTSRATDGRAVQCARLPGG